MHALFILGSLLSSHPWATHYNLTPVLSGITRSILNLY